MTDDPNKPQRIPPSLVTPVRNLKWTYQREAEGDWTIWAGDGGFVAEMVCSEEVVRKFVASGTPDSTTPTTGWNVLDNDGISVRFDEYGRLQIALNSPKGFVYQVTSWRPRTAEMLSDWLSKQDWEAIRKRALEVDARAFDGPDSIESPRTQANARLIAAAPELLEALAHMVAVSNWATTIQSEEQYDAMVANAEAAIRKAKGEVSDGR